MIKQLLPFFIAIFLLNTACHIPGASKSPPALGPNQKGSNATSTGTKTGTSTGTGTGTSTGKAATASEVYTLAKEFSLDATKEQDFRTAFQSFKQAGALDTLADEGAINDFALLIAKAQQSDDCDDILHDFFLGISDEKASDQANVILAASDAAPFVRLMNINDVGERIAKARWQAIESDEGVSQQLAQIKDWIDSANSVQEHHDAYVKFLQDHVSTTPDEYLSIMAKTSFSFGTDVSHSFRKTYEMKGDEQRKIMREALFLEAVSKEGIGNNKLGAVKIIKARFLPKAAWKENYELGTKDEGSLFDKICEIAQINKDSDDKDQLKSALGLDIVDEEDEDKTFTPPGDGKEEDDEEEGDEEEGDEGDEGDEEEENE